MATTGVDLRRRRVPSLGTRSLRSLSLRVQLLGPVRAWSGDDEIRLGNGGRSAVFSVLAMNANETVSRADLIDGLWGERPPAKAVGMLHTYIHDLRRALDPDRGKRADSTVLVTVQTSYSLQLLDEQFDERRFTAHHEQAQRHWAAGDLGAAVDALDAALALWRGGALHGVPGPFAQVQRARLDESRITAVERRGALLLLQGGHERVTSELTELVAEAPLRETARGLLMVALNQAGRRAEAVELYRDTERTLIDEQGIEPSPVLRRIHEDITAGRPVPPDAISAGIWTPRPVAESVVTLPETARPAPPPSLVGRHGEIEWLHSLLHDLHSGRGACVGIEGAQGIGKTALIAGAFAEPGDTYALVWGSLSDGADQLVQLIEQMSAVQPVVFVVDDIHSVSDDSELLTWHRLAHLTQQVPLLLVGVFRTLPHPARLRSAISATGGRVRTIGPLAADDVVLLAQRHLKAPCGPRLRELLGAAAGNPAFVCELLDTLTAAQALSVTDGGVDVSPDRQVEPDDVLTYLTRKRLGVLTPGAQNVLRWAALLGTRFDLGELAAVMGKSAADLVTAVDEAIVSGTVEDEGQGFAFRDCVLPRVLLEERPAETRAALHREAAEALAEAGVPAERVAAQLRATDQTDAWVVRWVLDNVDAVAARSQATAFELLDHIIAGVTANEEHHNAIALCRVRLAFRLGQRPRAEAEAVLARTGDAELRWLLANLDYQAGAAEKAAAHLRAAERDSTVPKYWRARYESLRAQFESGAEDLDVAEQATRTALRHATEKSDAKAALHAWRELWYFAILRRDHQAALAHAEAAMEVVQRNTSLSQWYLNVLEGRAIALQNLDRLEEATHALARMRYIGGRLQPPAGRPHVVTAVHEYWLGQWDEALAQLEVVTQNGDGQFHYPCAQSPLLHHGVAAMIAVHRGNTAELRAHLQAAQAYPVVTNRDRESSDYLVVARAFEAGIRLGPTAELDALAPVVDPDHGRATLRHQWLPRYVRLAMDLGDQCRVAEAVRVCEAEATREVSPARAHAALRWCRGLTDRAPDVLLDLARHFRAIGRSVEMAAVLVDAAAVLAEGKRTGLAKRTFANALTALGHLGAEADIDRATARMRELGVPATVGFGFGFGAVGVPPGRSAATGWGSLSDVERRVAELVVAGKAHPEIAAELALSRRDVQGHLSGAMRKLSVGSRAELAGRIREVAGKS
ncbi:BTAD domain-containing putative transcriptional regulator [Kibdelosporangium phytohabitans]|nr:BTAD domain-containing putative transcriptional regulator [Kibdelosporangium phytohabitans]MBE1463472.1 DNA-binding SARP family transcriptional activator/DNA-binding CsgD family transcriptional regulator [Kibdelosporangium phytohabitans]